MERGLYIQHWENKTTRDQGHDQETGQTLEYYTGNQYK